MTSQSEHAGTRIKAARLQRCPNESGRQFAKRAHLGYSHLNRIERGKTEPTVPTLKKLAQALGVGLSELLGSDAA